MWNRVVKRMAMLVALLILTVSAKAAGSQNTAPGLSEAQIAAIKAIQMQADQLVAPTAERLADVVQRLYANNLSDTPDESVRSALDAEMKELVWQLLVVKGDSMWAAFRVLTPAQKQRVRAEVAKPQKPGELPDVMEVIGKLFKSEPK